jgi:hypothetical protein
MERAQGKSKGAAEVTYKRHEHAKAAVDAYDGRQARHAFIMALNTSLALLTMWALAGGRHAHPGAHPG